MLRLTFAYLVVGLAAGLWGGVFAALQLAGIDNAFSRIVLVLAAFLTADYVWAMMNPVDEEPLLSTFIRRMAKR